MTPSSASTTSPQASRNPHGDFFRGRGFLTLLLVAALLWSLTSLSWGSSPVHPGGLGSIGQFFQAAIRPDLSAEFLGLVVGSAWKTVAYAVAGICLAVGLGLPLGILASGVLARSPRIKVPGIAGFRFLLGGMRAVHELIWAWFFVAAVGLSPAAAIFALAIPYAGILGRIYADILNDVPAEPLRALRASGASETKVLLYGRLPMALPDMLSYTFYRFECAIRSAAIMGFVGVGGLGMQIQLSLADLYFDEVWTLLYALVALVLLVDLWSSWVRRYLTS